MKTLLTRILFTKRNILITSLSIIAASLSACGGTNVDSNPSPIPPPSLELSAFKNLENLGPSAVYEGWIIANGAAVSTGRFTVNDSGILSQSKFNISQATYDNASTFILTIEPSVNDLPAPSDQHLIAGNFDTTKSANLTTSHPAAFGTDFSSASGSFILATPSSAATNDDNQGIWYLNIVAGTPKASLNLPTLPKGWTYEGWVVVNGKPISTGTFTNPALADSDGKGPTAGPLSGPPFPGQDFITPPVSLPGGAAVISIEPQPDNSPDPFVLKPLINTNIPASVGPANVHPLTNRGTSVLPIGVAKISK